MARTLSELKTKMDREVRDKTRGTLEDADETGFFNDGIDQMNLNHEWRGTKQRTEVKIYSTVNEYPIPTGYKAPIHLRVDGQTVDFDRVTPSEFWEEYLIEDNIIAIDNYNEEQVLLVKRDTNKGTSIIDGMNDDSGWGAASSTDATNVREDDVEYKEGNASIAFDVDVSLSGNDYARIENSSITSLDLSKHENKSSIFLWVFIPDVSEVESLDLRWGSSSSDYWEQNVTSRFSEIELRDGWNRVGFPWDGASQTGSPDSEGVTYLLIGVNYSNSQVDDTDFRVDDVRSVLPERTTLYYYSNNFVKKNDGTYAKKFEDDDDTTILDQRQDQILLGYALEKAFDYLREFDDATKARNRADRMLTQTAQDNPSEEQKETDQYIHFG